MALPKLPSLEELLKSGAHFGHQESRWHPKMAPYIFGARNGIHIIDLTQTNPHLQRAMEFVRDTVARGGYVLFLGTKRQAQEIVERHAKACNMPYVTGRWLGGTLTNFSEVIKLVKRLRELKDKKASGELAKKYKKKEVVRFEKELAELDGRVGGIENLLRSPDALFVVDVKKEKTAVQEALVKGIPVIAMADSNVNPANIAYPIPANDDAVKSIELMTNLMAQAVKEGQAIRVKEAAVAPKPAPKPSSAKALEGKPIAKKIITPAGEAVKEEPAKAE